MECSHWNIKIYLLLIVQYIDLVKFISPPGIKCHLTCFEPATSEEVRKLIPTSPTKTCSLDPKPTSLLKSCVNVLLTPITNIINLSLKSGVFPDTLKLSHITPLLKIS